MTGLKVSADRSHVARMLLPRVAPSLHSTAVFNNNVMVLPVAATDLGLTNANAAFNYLVFSFSRDANGLVDDSGTLTYHAAQPGIDVSGNSTGVPVYPDLAGMKIPVNFTRSSFVATKSQGILLLHHHNAQATRAEVIQIKGTR